MFSVMLSSSSYAKWTKVDESVSGNTFYVDFERIRKVDGFVYYWWLYDLLKPDKDGSLSSLNYIQGDCKLFRYKYLSIKKTKEPMGGGTGEAIFRDLNEVKDKVSLAKNYSQTKIPAELKLEASVECSVLSKDLEKDLHSALLNLGLKLKDISQVIVDLKKDYHGEQLGPLIRRALLLLGSRQKVQKSSYSLSKEKQRTSESNLDTLF